MVTNVNDAYSSRGGARFSREYPDTVIASVATIVAADQDIIAAGVKVGQGYIVVFEGLTAGVLAQSFCRATADDQLEVRFVNPTIGAIDPPDTGITMHVVGL